MAAVLQQKQAREKVADICHKLAISEGIIRPGRQILHVRLSVSSITSGQLLSDL